jgi:hypothetical protein
MPVSKSKIINEKRMAHLLPSVKILTMNSNNKGGSRTKKKKLYLIINIQGKWVSLLNRCTDRESK